MNYDLGKQLKDAGFPQKESNGFPGILNPDGDKTVYYPTLSELIEACGEGFSGLGRNQFRAREERIAWLASQKIDKFGNWLGLYGHGHSPEEAVANLWLALQPK